MKHYLLLTTFAFIYFSAVADTQQQVLQKLSTVNTEWDKRPEKNDLPKLDLSSKHSYEDWIATHLELVETFLRQRNTSTLSETQSANRSYLLQKLNSYWHERPFPVNDYVAYKTPVFIDRSGNHCAVGYLMQQSGAENLAQQINREQKFAFVADIKTKGVKQWADKNGFTLEELAWIQPSYCPTAPLAEVGTGANGPVTKLYYTDGANRFIIAGNFDTLGGIDCNNIGYYQPSTNSFNRYGSGLQGTIKDVTVLQNAVIMAAGSFDSAGVVYPLATCVQNPQYNWHRMEIPGRANAIATTVYPALAYTCEATIRHDSVPGKEELWRLNSNGQWTKKATFHGIVFSSQLYSYYATTNVMHAGAFDSVTVHIDSLTDTTLYVHNVLLRTYYTNEWFGIGNDVSDTVYVARCIGAALYFGGTCQNGQPSPHNICVTRYLNGTFQPLMYNYGFEGNTGSVRDLALYNQNSLLIAGDFEYNGFYSFRHLMKYDLATNMGEGYGCFNGIINTIDTDNSTWYIGGDFIMNRLHDTLPHLARIGLTTGLTETELGFSEVLIYPNPTTDQLTITADNQTPVMVSIYSATGVLMGNYQKSAAGAFTIPVSNLPPAYYLLKLSGKDGLSATKGFIVAR